MEKEKIKIANLIKNHKYNININELLYYFATLSLMGARLKDEEDI